MKIKGRRKKTDLLLYHILRSKAKTLKIVTLQNFCSKKHWLNMRATELREKCRYLEFFWSVFSRMQTEYGEILRIWTLLVQYVLNLF